MVPNPDQPHGSTMTHSEVFVINLILNPNVPKRIVIFEKLQNNSAGPSLSHERSEWRLLPLGTNSRREVRGGDSMFAKLEGQNASCVEFRAISDFKSMIGAGNSRMSTQSMCMTK